jgi:hypothetical protein
MITAVVRFRLPEGTTRDDAKAMFERSAPNYRGVPGLVRKYYLYGEDRTGGGVYLWNSREAAHPGSAIVPLRETSECDGAEARAGGTDRLYSRSARGTGADQQRRPAVKVRDAMHKGVDWVSPDTPVTELAKLMT